MSLSEQFLKKSKHARIAAWVSVLLIITTVGGIISFYSSSARINKYEIEIATLKNEISTINHENRVGLEQMRIIINNGLALHEKFDELIKDPQNLEIPSSELIKKIQIIRSTPGKSILPNEEKIEPLEDEKDITEIIITLAQQVGSVFIAIFLIQILLSVMRYHFRLADHYLILSEAEKKSDNVKEFKEYMNILSTKHIDFHKTPPSPADKVIELLKEAKS